MIETKIERELGLIMKTIKINYDGKLLSGADAFNKLIIDYDVLGKDYIINWEKIPVEINVL